MKGFNIYMFIADMGADMDDQINDIRNSETLNEAKKNASYASGRIDTVTMIANELKYDGDPDADLGALVDRWYYKIYNALANVAWRVGDNMAEAKFLKRMDEFDNK